MQSVHSFLCVHIRLQLPVDANFSPDTFVTGCKRRGKRCRKTVLIDGHLQHDHKELLDSFSGKYTLASILTVIVW